MKVIRLLVFLWLSWSQGTLLGAAAPPPAMPKNRGCTNAGNSCFINSVTQALMYSAPLRAFLQRAADRHWYGAETFMRLLINHIQAVEASVVVYNPRPQFRNQFARYPDLRDMGGFGQHDAGEFLQKTLTEHLFMDLQVMFDLQDCFFKVLEGTVLYPHADSVWRLLKDRLLQSDAFQTVIERGLLELLWLEQLKRAVRDNNPVLFRTMILDIPPYVARDSKVYGLRSYVVTDTVARTTRDCVELVARMRRMSATVIALRRANQRLDPARICTERVPDEALLDALAPCLAPTSGGDRGMVAAVLCDSFYLPSTKVPVDLVGVDPRVVAGQISGMRDRLEVSHWRILLDRKRRFDTFLETLVQCAAYNPDRGDFTDRGGGVELYSENVVRPGATPAQCANPWQLIVSLPRNTDAGKDQAPYSFPLVMTFKGTRYILYALVVHGGESLDAGHYWAYVQWQGNWFLHDDCGPYAEASSMDVVRAIATNGLDVRSGATPYILAFVRESFFTMPGWGQAPAFAAALDALTPSPVVPPVVAEKQPQPPVGSGGSRGQKTGHDALVKQLDGVRMQLELLKVRIGQLQKSLSAPAA